MLLIRSSIFLIEIDKEKGFDFASRYQTDETFNKFTDNKDQSPATLQPSGEAVVTFNNNQEVNEEAVSYHNIRDLIQDRQQMFRLDCDPQFFDSNFEVNLNNNLGLEQIKDYNIHLSDSWIPAPADLEMFSDLPDDLFEEEMKEEKQEASASVSPLPSPPSPQIVEGVQVKSENQFDLIKYIIFGDVSLEDCNEIGQLLNYHFPQNADLLTPVDEKPCPSFPQPQIEETVVIKAEPEPSTSAAPSPKPFIPEDVENVKSTRRRVAKRRYSSDSDYSIKTSASSFNSTTQRSSKKKRGRPSKELITDLPTIDDFKHMPVEHASHLVLRIKNNEASRKSRMKSKSKQTAMEDEFDRLAGRQKRLKLKRNKLESQIEVLRRWLLGIN